MSDQPPDPLLRWQPRRSHWLPRAAFLLTVAAVVFGLAGFTLYRDQQRLRELGVATWQGFLKSGPVPGSELPGLME